MKKTSLFLFAFMALFLVTSCDEDETNEPSGPQEKHISLSLQPDGESGKDAIVSKLVPDNNYSENANIHLYAWTQSGKLNVLRVFMDFDLSSVPAEAQIDSAYLSLYFNKTSQYGSEHKGETSFKIQCITSDWDESSITWNTQPSTTTSNEVLVDGAVSSTQDFEEIDVTELVEDMILDQENTYGFSLRLQKEEVYKMLLLASSDNADESLRPKLEVFYTIVE